MSSLRATGPSQTERRGTTGAAPRGPLAATATCSDLGPSRPERSFRRATRRTSRPQALHADRCRMGWVTELWDAREGYNTHRSAFWRVLRRIVLSDTTPGLDDSRWSSRLAWTNLYKVSPAAGWNPPRGSPASAASVGDRTA